MKKMRIEPNAYIAKIQFSTGRAVVICHTYYIAPSKEHVGVEFFQISQTSNERFGIPDGIATFQEELRTFNTAAGIAPNRVDETLYIQQKLYEAYGAGAKVHIHPIKAAEDSSDHGDLIPVK